MNNPLEMSDDDFLKSQPPAIEEQEESKEDNPDKKDDADSSGSEDQVDQDPDNSNPDEGNDNGDQSTNSDDPDEGEGEGNDQQTEPDGEQSGSEGEENNLNDKKDADSLQKTNLDDKISVKDDSIQKKSSTDSDKDKSKITPSIDYEGFYKKIMKPLKANGKMIELRTPEEAIQLMQMGANYTRKMQAIAPYRKTLLMLENNGLLDENKLSFLIDLDKKNPEAIKKLIKESGIDPMEIDTDADIKYQEGNHRVTDEEATFASIINDIRESDNGTETLNVINSWDDASKEVLWKNPEIARVIHEQINSDNKIFEIINNEINRRKTLGTIPPNTPFLQAYKIVGDELVQEANRQQQLQARKEPVVTKPAVKKSKLTNSDKVKSAATTRTTSKTATKFINPLAMDDDEFLKQMKNRL